jgi:dienelactone hydrolase
MINVSEWTYPASDGMRLMFREYIKKNPSHIAGYVAVAPGWGGGCQDYQPLAKALAQRNYIVGVCDFRDSRNPDPEVLRQDELRVRDFRAFCEFVKPTRVPLHVIGHSGGSKCALAVSGAAYASLEDLLPLPELASCIALSPQGVDESSETTVETADSIRVPVMYGTGTLDEGGRTGDPWAWRTNLFYLGANTPRYLYVLHDATHAQVGLTGREPIPSDMESASVTLILNFLSTYGENSPWGIFNLYRKTMLPPAAFERIEGVL